MTIKNDPEILSKWDLKSFPTTNDSMNNLYVLEKTDRRAYPHVYAMQDKQDIGLESRSLKNRATKSTRFTNFCNWISGVFKSVVSCFVSNDAEEVRPLTRSQ